jgi:hypothetical protein
MDRIFLFFHHLPRDLPLASHSRRNLAISSPHSVSTNMWSEAATIIMFKVQRGAGVQPGGWMGSKQRGDESNKQRCTGQA